MLIKKIYELIAGNKVFKDKKKINWKELIDEFINEEELIEEKQLKIYQLIIKT